MPIFAPVASYSSSQTYSVPGFGDHTLELDCVIPDPPSTVNTVVVLVTVTLQGFNGLNTTVGTGSVTDDGGGSYGSPLFWVNNAYGPTGNGPSIGMWVGHPGGAGTVKATFTVHHEIVPFNLPLAATMAVVQYNFPTFPTVQDFDVQTQYAGNIPVTLNLTDSLGNAVQVSSDSNVAASGSKGYGFLDLLVDGVGSDYLIVAGAGSGLWPPLTGCCAPILALPASGYDGTFTIEQHQEPGGGPITDSMGYWDRVQSNVVPPPPDTATVDCEFDVTTPPIGGATLTLRYEIPQRRWFPHRYADTAVVHYLDEPSEKKPNDQQLLILSGQNIFKAGGNTDNGVDIESVVQTPSYDGGDERAQKLFVDTMTELDQVGDFSAEIRFNNNNIGGPTLVMSPTGLREQFLENIASLGDLSLYRNINLLARWTGGPDGPRWYAWEPSGYAQPYVSKRIVTQFINLAFQGWKHHRRIYAGLIATVDVLFTVKCQDGRTFNYTIPNTGGQFKVVPLIVDNGVKDLAFGYELEGANGSQFALFPDAFTLETKSWDQPQYIHLAVFAV